MNSPSVALYSPGWPPGNVANGIVTYVGHLRDALREQGRTAHVLSSTFVAGASDMPDVVLSDLPEPRAQRFLGRALHKVPYVDPVALPLALRLATGMRKLARRHQVSLIEVEESFGSAWFLQQMLDIPVVVRLHGPWFLNGTALGIAHDGAFARRNAAERRCMREADGLTSPSRDVLEAVRRTHNLELPHAAVIANAAPVVEIERRWTRSNADEQTVLFVGRFDRHKGGDIAIDAFAKIAAECPQAHLIFVGPDRGLQDRAGRTYDLKGYLADRLTAAQQARVDVRGSLPLAQIEPLRRSASVTIIPSRYENFGLALVEALAFGCPTVASNIGGNPEILQDNVTGLLVPPDDSSALANAVVGLFKDQERAAALGEKAAKDLAERLSPARIASQTWEYYESVWARVGSHKPKRPLQRLLPLLGFV